MGYSILLGFHICAAIVGLLAGTAALIFRKGARWHRATGKVFFASMLIMAGSGAFIAAFLKPNMGNVFGGVLTFYLVGTGWLAVIRKEGLAGRLEFGLMMIALAQAAGGLICGLQAANSMTGLKDGYPPMLYFIFGSIAFLCASLDFSVVVRHGVSGAQRIARHLWRMCFAMLIATASFFLGKQQHFPKALRGSQVLNVPVYLVIGVMIYWLFRVLLTKAYKKRTLPKVSRVYLPAS
jgi:hypothetical protein